MKPTFTPNDIRQLLKEEFNLELKYEFNEVDYFPKLFGAENLFGLDYSVNDFRVILMIEAHDTTPKITLNYPNSDLKFEKDLNQTILRVINIVQFRLEDFGRFESI